MNVEEQLAERRAILLGEKPPVPAAVVDRVAKTQVEADTTTTTTATSSEAGVITTDDIVTTVQTVKAGWRSSEFWTTVAQKIIGTALIVFGIHKDNNMLIAIGGGIGGVSNAAYAISRAITKRK